MPCPLLPRGLDSDGVGVFLVFVLVSYGVRDKAVLAPRLLNQTGEAKAAIQRAFDSVQVTPTYTACADV